MIKVSIAKLGTAIQNVEIVEGSSVMEALRSAGYNLDGVVNIKRNGSVVTMDTVLADNDVLLVSMEKIKGGVKSVETEPQILRLSFNIRKEDEAGEGQMLFTDDMDTFQIVKEVMHQKGRSLNEFKELIDKDGNKISFADKLVDEGEYTIIICAHQNCQEDDCDDC